MKKVEKDAYIVLRGGYHTIASKVTTSEKLAQIWCEELQKKAQNKNCYYVQCITLIEEI